MVSTGRFFPKVHNKAGYLSLEVAGVGVLQIPSIGGLLVTRSPDEVKLGNVHGVRAPFAGLQTTNWSEHPLLLRGRALLGCQ